MSLIEVAGALGDPAIVEAHRQFLEARTLPAMVDIDFQMTLGRAYQSLGDIAAAAARLRRAVALAERCGTGRELIETEATIAELSRTQRAATASLPLPNSTPDVSRPVTARTHLATGRYE